MVKLWPGQGQGQGVYEAWNLLKNITYIRNIKIITLYFSGGKLGLLNEFGTLSASR